MNPVWNQLFAVYWYERVRPSYMVLRLLDQVAVALNPRGQNFKNIKKISRSDHLTLFLLPQDSVKNDCVGEIMIPVASAISLRKHGKFPVGCGKPQRKQSPTVISFPHCVNFQLSKFINFFPTAPGRRSTVTGSILLDIQVKNPLGVPDQGMSCPSPSH